MYGSTTGTVLDECLWYTEGIIGPDLVFTWNSHRVTPSDIAKKPGLFSMQYRNAIVPTYLEGTEGTFEGTFGMYLRRYIPVCTLGR